MYAWIVSLITIWGIGIDLFIIFTIIVMVTIMSCKSNNKISRNENNLLSKVKK